MILTPYSHTPRQILVFLLFLSVMVIWRFHLQRLRFLHETGVSLIIGGDLRRVLLLSHCICWRPCSLAARTKQNAGLYHAGLLAGLIINAIESNTKQLDTHPAVCNSTLRDSYQSEVSHAKYVEDIEAEVRQTGFGLYAARRFFAGLSRAMPCHKPTCPLSPFHHPTVLCPPSFPLGGL